MSRSLRVLNCDNCGACCMHMGTPPGFAVFFGDWPQDELEHWPDWPIWKTVPAQLKAELGEYYRAMFAGEIPDRTLNDDTPCLWFDEATRRCRHWEHRPVTCRDFEIGSQACVEHRINRGIDKSTLSMVKR